jgi:hypothetical protein
MPQPVPSRGNDSTYIASRFDIGAEPQQRLDAFHLSDVTGKTQRSKSAFPAGLEVCAMLHEVLNDLVVIVALRSQAEWRDKVLHKDGVVNMRNPMLDTTR